MRITLCIIVNALRLSLRERLWGNYLAGGSLQRALILPRNPVFDLIHPPAIVRLMTFESYFRPARFHDNDGWRGAAIFMFPGVEPDLKLKLVRGSRVPVFPDSIICLHTFETVREHICTGT